MAVLLPKPPLLHTVRIGLSELREAVSSFFFWWVFALYTAYLNHELIGWKNDDGVSPYIPSIIWTGVGGLLLVIVIILAYINNWMLVRDMGIVFYLGAGTVAAISTVVDQNA